MKKCVRRKDISLMTDTQPPTTTLVTTLQPSRMSNMSQVLLAIRPWNHTQQMSDIIVAVLGMNIDGVLWGATTTENVGYGIADLLVTAVIDESKISMEALLEEFIALDEIISRVDIRLWNKVQ